MIAKLTAMARPVKAAAHRARQPTATKAQGRSGTRGPQRGALDPCDGQPVTHAFMFRMKESEVYPDFFFAYPVVLTRVARHSGVGLAPRVAAYWDPLAHRTLVPELY
jgi:hypothetical protein